jgi:hypothetical protein
LEEKVAALVYKADNTAMGIRCADHASPSIHKSWHYLRRQAVVARLVGAPNIIVLIAEMFFLCVLFYDAVSIYITQHQMVR